MVDLSQVIGFDRDDGNARKNERHRVTAAEAEQVFFNVPLLLLDDSRHSDSEVRYRALGKTAAARRLHLSFALRSEAKLIRVISARDMSRNEKAIYEQAP